MQKKLRDQIAPLERIRTGVPGLDELLHGGLIRGRVYLVEGSPGSGKTILANQVCFHHVRNTERAVFLTLLAESHAHMVQNLSTLSFFDESKVFESLHYVSAYETLEKAGLDALLKNIASIHKKFQISFLVIDGFELIRWFSESEIAYSKFIHKLSAFLHLARCTSLFLVPSEETGRFAPEHTLADGLIRLNFDEHGLRTLRQIEVMKFRGGDHMEGKHMFEITRDGIQVFPRIEHSTIAMPGENVQFPLSNFSSSSLNQMFQGGLPAASTTVVMGPAGAGKTLLCLDFLSAGADRGEPGLFFGFYESPQRLLEVAECIGLSFSKHVKEGLIDVIWKAPQEQILDALARQIFDAVEKRNVRRLVIDGTDGLLASSAHPERISPFMAALSNKLRSLGVSTLFTEEMELFSEKIKFSIADMSAIMENAVLLRYVEQKAQLYRLISVLKVRGSSYDTSIRQFVISDRGIEAAESFQSAEAILRGAGDLGTGATLATPKRSARGATPRRRRRTA